DAKNMTKLYDVVIVGAGPAGCTLALALKDANLNVLLLERAKFPRDKVCGDAIPGRAVKILEQLDPRFVQAFDEMPEKAYTKETIFWANDQRHVRINWVNKAFTCARLDFDQQLFQLVQQYTSTKIVENCVVRKIHVHPLGVELECSGSKTFQAKVIIGCDGARSVVRQQLTDYKSDPLHSGSAVRAYYSNVHTMQAHCTEVYMQKEHLPGYFWLFPLPNGRANAGFGMRADYIAKHRINLKDAFYQFIEASPILKEKLKDATLEGKILGFGLPFGSQKVQVSGERFLLTGDAASLIDPSTGDGIGNAMLSARVAAEQIQRSFQAQRFDADFLSHYDVKLYDKLWSELRLRTLAQRSVGRFPWLLDLGMRLGNMPIIGNYMRKFA
ncbi:MAG: geranylgeranyl reductase family protein, partial [Bacteroidota bacterium]